MRHWKVVSDTNGRVGVEFCSISGRSVFVYWFEDAEELEELIEALVREKEE